MIAANAWYFLSDIVIFFVQNSTREDVHYTYFSWSFSHEVVLHVEYSIPSVEMHDLKKNFGTMSTIRYHINDNNIRG